MLFLIDPSKATKKKCTDKCTPVCGPRVYPMYGIDPDPI